ncbi:glycerate kinase [Paracoccus sp. SCSIO 75233]|uniref:glycerate kinase type-2 family protein n=1 Tax=Paracoccus sp. SCSIO 75233 TaxID=3017782 RepID=UPI0022F0D6E0|nr:glycerate kinase [Paracoccus sp. SCSIO 75233]WBU54565.1 glycerate kinase [Paracoccus sp. SCSIO 75233]
MGEAEFLRAMFDRAVAVADPMRFIAVNLPEKPTGRLLVVGAGKASARMAEAVEAEWGPCEGLVITRYGYGRPTQGIEIVEAAHPVPDQAGVEATTRMLNLLDGLGADDLVVMLISGGASALLCAPAGAMTLEEKQAVNAALLSSGAPIGDMNVLRKHLSRVKGGQLAAAAAPARVVALMISDVPGDDPGTIGSGPTVGDGSTTQDARAIVDRWKIALPETARQVLGGRTGVVPKGDELLSRVENRVVAAPAQSLAAAADLAREAGYACVIIGDDLDGEAREVAAKHAALALTMQADMTAGDDPVIVLSGGELTVTRRGDGVGGPNAEYALALAAALDAAPGIHAIACDTDGVDGAAEVAGAIISPDTLARARAAGLDPAEALAKNDAHSFFAALGDQVVTGPTLTNVNDFRAIIIHPA